MPDPQPHLRASFLREVPEKTVMVPLVAPYQLIRRALLDCTDTFLSDLIDTTHQDSD